MSFVSAFLSPPFPVALRVGCGDARVVGRVCLVLAKVFLVLSVSYTQRAGRGGSYRAMGVSAIVTTSGRGFLRFPKEMGTTRSVDLSFQMDNAVGGVCIGSKTRMQTKRLLTRLSPASCRMRLSTARTRCHRMGTRTREIVTLCGRGKAAPGTGSGTICKLGRVATGCGRRRSRLTCAHLCTPFDKCMRGHLFRTRRAVKTNVPIVSVMDTNTPRIRVGLPTTRCVQHGQFGHCRYAFSVCPKRACPLRLVDIAPGTGTGRLCAVQLRLVPKGRTIPSPKVGTVIAVFYSASHSNALSIPADTVLRGSKGSCIFVCGTSSRAMRGYRMSMLQLAGSKCDLVSSSKLRPKSGVMSSKMRRVRGKRAMGALPRVARAGVKKLLW